MGHKAYLCVFAALWMCACCVSAQSPGDVLIKASFAANGDIVYQGHTYTFACPSLDGIVTPTDPQFWIDLWIVVALIAFGGLMSGLTVGLLGLDTEKLQSLAITGDHQERTLAARVLPIRQKHHLLLVTLLLCNAAAMETLPIFLDRLLPSFLAIIVSVTLVLFFGEVIPQAVCTGPKQLRIAARLSWFVNCLMILVSPVAYPLGKLLDKLLGSHTHDVHYSKVDTISESEFESTFSDTDIYTDTDTDLDTYMLAETTAIPAEVKQTHEKLSFHDVSISSWLRHKTVAEVMLSLSKTYMVNREDKLDVNHLLNNLIKVHGSPQSVVPLFTKTSGTEQQQQQQHQQQQQQQPQQHLEHERQGQHIAQDGTVGCIPQRVITGYLPTLSVLNRSRLLLSSSSSSENNNNDNNSSTPLPIECNGQRHLFNGERQPFLIHRTQSVSELLHAFISTRKGMAVVVNNIYGSATRTSGNGSATVVTSSAERGQEGEGETEGCVETCIQYNGKWFTVCGIVTEEMIYQRLIQYDLSCVRIWKLVNIAVQQFKKSLSKKSLKRSNPEYITVIEDVYHRLEDLEGS